MISFDVDVQDSKGKEHAFSFDSLDSNVSRNDESFSVTLDCAVDPFKVIVTPKSDVHITNVTYRVSTSLKNFHHVIVPDTGRSYPKETQLVDFWGRNFPSRINNIRMPVFILTGQNQSTQLMFGVIGENYETDFIVKEPLKKRALLTWMKRFTLEIRRGVDHYPVPDFALDENGALIEYIWFSEHMDEEKNWVVAMRDFSNTLAAYTGASAHTTSDSLLPYWCSWTDWDSLDVDEALVRDNVKKGVELGIKNFIIDDGWFGPGLDSEFDVKLTLGDWKSDPQRFPSITRLVKEIQDNGGNALIWCAPHAVSPDAACREARAPFFIQYEKGNIFKTHNGYHSLCFMSPEARRIMVDICVDLVKKYGVDGAKYDLFNNIPGEPCVSCEHSHDTSSMIEGLRRTLEEIHRRTTEIKPEFITELKQNYATPYLYGYGTCVRAGDTPYNPEGNFIRTAYIAAYTPYSSNDYQTITDRDSPEESKTIIGKMLAVGVPTYSMDCVNLSEKTQKILAWYNAWYTRNLDVCTQWRTPLDPGLSCWYTQGEAHDIYFLVNDAKSVECVRCIDTITILNATFSRSLFISLPCACACHVRIDNVESQPRTDFSRSKEDVWKLDVLPGDIITITPGQ